MSRIMFTALLALAPVSAFATETAPSARVAVADLDLGAPAGIDRLDRRLKGAVRKVCPQLVTLSLLEARDQRGCVREASRSAQEGRARVLARAADRQVQVAVSAR